MVSVLILSRVGLKKNERGLGSNLRELFFFLEVMLLPTCITALALHLQAFVHKKIIKIFTEELETNN